jgi:hypothetical protein
LHTNSTNFGRFFFEHVGVNTRQNFTAAANIKTTVGVTACREIICPDDEKAPTSGVPWKSYPNFNNATSELEFATTATKRIHWQLLMAISKCTPKA